MIQVSSLGRLKLIQLFTLSLVFGAIAGLMSLLLWYSGASGTSGIVFAILLSFAMVFIQWLLGPWLIKMITGIKEVSPAQAPELHAMMERLAKEAFSYYITPG